MPRSAGLLVFLELRDRNAHDLPAAGERTIAPRRLAVVVFVSVIDWTTTCAPPPFGTPPTLICPRAVTAGHSSPPLGAP